MATFLILIAAGNALASTGMLVLAAVWHNPTGSVVPVVLSLIMAVMFGACGCYAISLWRGRAAG